MSSLMRATKSFKVFRNISLYKSGNLSGLKSSFISRVELTPNDYSDIYINFYTNADKNLGEKFNNIGTGVYRVFMVLGMIYMYKVAEGQGQPVMWPRVPKFPGQVPPWGNVPPPGGHGTPAMWPGVPKFPGQVPPWGNVPPTPAKGETRWTVNYINDSVVHLNQGNEDMNGLIKDVAKNNERPNDESQDGETKAVKVGAKNYERANDGTQDGETKAVKVGAKNYERANDGTQDGKPKVDLKFVQDKQNVSV